MGTDGLGLGNGNRERSWRFGRFWGVPLRRRLLVSIITAVHILFPMQT